MAKREALKRDLDKAGGKIVLATADDEAAQSAGNYIPPSRRGKVTFAIHVDPAVRAQTKMLAAKRHTTVQALVEEGLNLLFEKYGEKPIA